ncbi:MAG: hypothetical protein NVS1B2_23480 [Vulcanimicrobiaceae bacterium]
MNFLDEIDPRVRAGFALRFVAGAVAPPRTAHDVRDAVAALRRSFDDDAVARELRADPPFPGVTAGIDVVGGRERLVYACRIASGDVDLGVAITVIVVDRRIEITLAPPATPIPPTWTSSEATDAAR